MHLASVYVHLHTLVYIPLHFLIIFYLFHSFPTFLTYDFYTKQQQRQELHCAIGNKSNKKIRFFNAISKVYRDAEFLLLSSLHSEAKSWRWNYFEYYSVNNFIKKGKRGFLKGTGFYKPYM
jgi:hypothetical protein